MYEYQTLLDVFLTFVDASFWQTRQINPPSFSGAISEELSSKHIHVRHF